ncbi:sensor histidine kinase [Pseudobacteriovorax antillogorgiicola]|uniref:histidine kinase n=1 Tax=Pseudobacteriovorax antillogorgiicola TaxID=1513793 RepID=A0A1Y6CJX5_9BACT|nr:ATP-binding protein [Pseudobacteriovorax antillogorgiicola]TCS45883.1 phospho-acceptor domain-containing protein [Pseudobacteriovorax antillogorgiicola]SMF71215.1 His Kinase A (phospho-acceptor) domain-containing protein [Pseudobacteriovorax antillogorgiicola]
MSTEKDIRWYNITVSKAVGIAALIIICGYVGSIIAMREAIDALSPIIHDPEIERSLQKQLQRIKSENRLQRQLLPHLLREKFIEEDEVSPSDLKEFLATVNLSNSNFLGMITFIPSASPNDHIEWISSTELQVKNLLIKVPFTGVKNEFERTMTLMQRYQLIRGTWKSQIGPTFIKVHGVILIITFAVLGGALVVLLQKYRRRIHYVIGGFKLWSEKDPGFRFQSNEFNDEMATICEQFNVMADEVEANRKRTLYLEKMSSWQTIAKKMAHEIKNPLTPIKMMVSHVVRKYPGEDEGYQKTLEECQTIIIEEVNSLRRMVDSFSQFAQLPQPKFETQDLIPLCQHVVEIQSAAFSQHKIELATKLDQALCHIDPQLIRQVLTNISKNAAEASEACNITLALESDLSYYILTIRDDGPGIPEDILSRIFEAYFTTKHTGDSPGMGLGLAICKKIILDHSGELLVESRPGLTEFSIRLPKLDPQALGPQAT